MAHILVVQWHSAIRSLMRLLLRQRGYRVTAVGDLDAIPSDENFDLFCLDLTVPGVDRDQPIRSFWDSPIGQRFKNVPLLVTDVNGLLETKTPPGIKEAAGVFTPRTGRGFPFLVEVERLLPPPTQIPQPVYSWRLDKQELPAFLFACFLFGVSGVLTLRDRTIHKQLHLVDGWVRSARSSVESDWLGKMLLARHQVTPERLNEVERALSESDRRIGEEITARGLLSEDELSEALSQQYTAIAMSVFEWDQSEISLDDGGPNPQPHLLQHPFRVLLSGLNYGFNAREVGEMLGGEGRYPAPTVWTAFRFADVDLATEEKHLLGLVNGQRSLARIIELSEFSAEATQKFILALTIMHAVYLSDEPKQYPVTFEQQLQGRETAIIEDEFFREPADEITFDDVEDPVDVEPFDEEHPVPWSKQLNVLELKEGVRYLLLVVLGVVVIWTGVQFVINRDVERKYFEITPEPHSTSQTVLIRRPVYEEADRLLANALLLLKEQGWKGVPEARSLIGGALNIDPRFAAAIDTRDSLELLVEARVALNQNRQQDARNLLEKAYSLSPENPLVHQTMHQLGMKIPE